MITVTKADYYIELRKITAILEVYAAAASSPLQLIASLPVPCVAQNHRGACQGTDTNGSQPYNLSALYAVNNGGINVYKPAGAAWSSFNSAGFAGTFVYTRTLDMAEYITVVDATGADLKSQRTMSADRFGSSGKKRHTVPTARARTSQNERAPSAEGAAVDQERDHDRRLQHVHGLVC